MELSGDEKRIQALFSELSLEDQSLVPRFEKLWLGAEMNARVPAPGIMRPVAVIVTVIVLAAVGSIAASSWYRSSTHLVNIPPQTIPAAPRVKQPEKLLSADSRTSPTRRLRRPVRQRQTVTTEESTLANWQSPTSSFLQAPTAFALSSLPQLNQSARELEMFLPKNNETMKESKQ
ncbi:MAG TPA: hypothetical protein VLB46_14635 [Pyrinomonadaceae bacterium]|nr:hypothetical protein [Pyrinomonadaceae bacterium]